MSFLLFATVSFFPLARSSSSSSFSPLSYTLSSAITVESVNENRIKSPANHLTYRKRLFSSHYNWLSWYFSFGKNFLLSYYPTLKQRMEKRNGKNYTRRQSYGHQNIHSYTFFMESDYCVGFYSCSQLLAILLHGYKSQWKRQQLSALAI